MTGRPLVCLDLDRTTIYSPAALLLPGPDIDAPRLLCVEVYRGAPLSFVTEAAAALYQDLCGRAVVVPTTTRTPEQLARVHLPDPPAGSAEPRFAITTNGGHLIVDGLPDAGWSARVRDRLARCAPLAEVLARVESVRGAFVETVRVARDLFVYCVVDRAELPTGWQDDLAGFCAERGWTVSVQGRKVYVVPEPLTKSAAVAEVARRVGARTVFAAGDSLLDRDMLEAADHAVRPAQGELADIGYGGPRLHVTTSPGVLGGEELLRWLSEHPDLPPPGVPEHKISPATALPGADFTSTSSRSSTSTAKDPV